MSYNLSLKLAIMMFAFNLSFSQFSAFGSGLRVASGSLASDEILFELLNDSKNNHKLIAVSTLAFDKQYSNIYHRLDSKIQRFGLEIESIVKLKPDLVFLASFNDPSFKFTLEKMKIKVIELNKFDDIENIFENIKIIAAELNITPKAELLIRSLRLKLGYIKSEIEKKCSKKQTLLNYSTSQHLYGKNTLFDSMIQSLGAKNLASESGLSGWPQVSLEFIAGLNPDYVILNADYESYKNIHSSSVWSKISAIKEGRLIFVPSSLLLSTSHFIVNAIEVMANQLCL